MHRKLHHYLFPFSEERKPVRYVAAVKALPVFADAVAAAVVAVAVFVGHTADVGGPALRLFAALVADVADQSVDVADCFADAVDHIADVDDSALGLFAALVADVVDRSADAVDRFVGLAGLPGRALL